MKDGKRRGLIEVSYRCDRLTGQAAGVAPLEPRSHLAEERRFGLVRAAVLLRLT